MVDRPTFASVTDTPCTCEYLQHAADEPRNPIVFDATTNEYQFRYPDPDPDCVGSAMLIIYHCPFCGGCAPESRRHLLFAVIAPEEESRLFGLLDQVDTISTALAKLGQPTRDDATGSQKRHEKAGQPNSIQRFRTLVYENLSDVADVWITERENGKAFCQLQGKYIGSP